eukprot:61440-Rhodomonas_salina.1
MAHEPTFLRASYAPPGTEGIRCYEAAMRSPAFLRHALIYIRSDATEDGSSENELRWGLYTRRPYRALSI